MTSTTKDTIPEIGILDSRQREMTAQIMLAVRVSNAVHSAIWDQNRSFCQLSGSGLPASPADTQPDQSGPPKGHMKRQAQAAPDSVLTHSQVILSPFEAVSWCNIPVSSREQ